MISSNTWRDSWCMALERAIYLFIYFFSCRDQIKPDKADMLLSVQQHVRERCPLLSSDAVHERAALNAESAFTLRVTARAQPGQPNGQEEMFKTHLD